MIRYLWLSVLVLVGCESVEPRATRVQDRLRPPYNYALMQKIDDNTMDYQWSHYNDGYYRTGEKFKDAYLQTMKETNDMSHENAYEVYKKQKYEIARKYKTQEGEAVMNSKEKEAIEGFSPSGLKEGEEIIITDEDEFAVTKDIIIEVDQVTDTSRTK